MMSPSVKRRFYSPEETRTQTGLSEPTLWRLRKAGKFPKPVQLSKRRVGYPAELIDAWIEEKITDSQVAA